MRKLEMDKLICNLGKIESILGRKLLSNMGIIKKRKWLLNFHDSGMKKIRKLIQILCRYHYSFNINTEGSKYCDKIPSGEEDRE